MVSALGKIATVIKVSTGRWQYSFWIKQLIGNKSKIVSLRGFNCIEERSENWRNKNSNNTYVIGIHNIIGTTSEWADKGIKFNNQHRPDMKNKCGYAVDYVSVITHMCARCASVIITSAVWSCLKWSFACMMIRFTVLDWLLELEHATTETVIDVKKKI